MQDPERESSEPKEYREVGACLEQIAVASGCSIERAEQEIALRLINGLIRSRATTQRICIKGRYGEEIETREVLGEQIPHWFWAGCLRSDYGTSDWVSGVFSGVCNRDKSEQEITVYGVELSVSDISGIPHAIAPGSQFPKAGGSQKSTAAGRNLSERWPNWIAELAHYIHHEGVPPGSGVSGQDDMIGAIETRMIERSLKAPGRTTVQPAVRAVLLRLRSADN